MTIRSVLRVSRASRARPSVASPTPLESAILKANREQYPVKAIATNLAPASTAEDALFWMLTKLMGFAAPEREAVLFKEKYGRKWRFDFVYRPTAMARGVIFEVEGGIWRKGGGAHSRPANIERDIEKYNTATLEGYDIYRLTPDMIRDGRAYNLLRSIPLKPK